jgi:cytochrome c2
MNIKFLKNQLILALFVFGIFFNLNAQSVEEGKQLFKDKICASCRNRDMKTDLVGPALAGVEGRWENKDDLFQWIREPQKLLDANHKYATTLFEKFHKIPMTPSADLSDVEIESMLLYIRSQSGEEMAVDSEGSEDIALALKGKELFKSKICAACHDAKMKTNLVGPNLTGVEDRWENKEDLYQWIREPQKLLDANHAYATQLFEEFNKIPMTPNTSLTDDEIIAILAFIKMPNAAMPVAKADDASYLELSETTTEVVVEEPSFFTSLTFYLILLVLLLLVAFMLAYKVAKTKVRAYKDEFGEEKKLCVFGILFFNRTVMKFTMFAFMVFGIYYTAVRGIDLGRQQGYQPDQPIAYSHKVHAGDNAIDCEFCHDAARRSRHAMIPGTNTCMKCHKAIKTGSQYGTQELTKIYASIGFDPSTGKYMENYNEMSQEDVKNVFTNWIKANNKDDVAEEQWKNIVTSLTNEHKPNVQGTIEWTRVHNLPDHVYFNHSQHVTVGKLECQDCHGPVEEMEIVSQYAPLSMGWCINCHRKTEVKFEDNKYYDQYYAKFHE